MKIAIVTDSSCDIDYKLLKKYDIEVIPLRVIYKSGEYKDGLDIKPMEVYRRLSEEIPKTSLPAPNDVLNKFKELKNSGYTHILAITISSGLSGTYNMFKLLAEELEGVNIEVVDSKTLSMGLGFLVIEAAKMIKNNIAYDDIIKKTNDLKAKMKILYVVDTLEYLKKGGRIGLVASSIGSVLNIKPIISVNEEGKYYIYSKARGNVKAIKSILEVLFSSLDNVKMNVAVMHGMAQDKANEIYEKIKIHNNVTSIYMSEISPSLGVHTGPGLIGLVFHPV